MALQIDSWAVAGAQSSAQIARLMLQSATRNGNGIVESADLEVTELDVPGTSVQVAAGAAVILGQEAAFQGSYYAHNVGVATVPISATDSGGGRSDMVVLQVEDPGIDGTPWTHDPAVDPVYYFRVIEGVGPTDTEPPAGLTAIPLARIDIPVSTATITDAYITDLRQMLQPRSEYVIRTQQGITPTDYAGNITSPSWENWPDLTWTVDIPAWATQVQIDASWVNMGFFPDDHSGSGSNDARGETRISLISGGNSIVTAVGAYNFNEVSATNGYRVNMGVLDDISIPAVLRGTTAEVRMQVSGDPLAGGRLRADAYMHAGVRMMFNEVPVAAAS